MRLVADASTLVAEALRERGHRLLRHPTLDLVVVPEAWSETEHELRRRIDVLAERRRIAPEEVAETWDRALAILITQLTLLAEHTYSGYLAAAHRRVPRDPNDAPTVAAAPALDCGIWTADHDFSAVACPCGPPRRCCCTSTGSRRPKAAAVPIAGCSTAALCALTWRIVSHARVTERGRSGAARRAP